VTRKSPSRRPYVTGDAEVDAAVDALLSHRADHPQADLVREMVVTCMKFLDAGGDRGDLKQMNAALKELRYATKVFSPHSGARKVSIFGSARMSPDTASYGQAVEFSRRMADAGWMVITGAGPGIMQAGNEGAGPERSFGVNIRLPFEQSANAVVVDSPHLVTFKYFFTRKLFFVKESHAVVLFPGGFGTLDEGMEALTLIQTGKTEPVPVVLCDDSGEDYWQSLDVFFREELLRRGLISPEDLHLYRLTDSVDGAVEEVLRFYSNYHSSRHMRDRFLVRLHRPPPAGALEELRRDFRWMFPRGEGAFEVREGRIEGEGPAPPGDPPFRLLFPFDRRSYGRLRQFIDRINTW